MTQKANALRGQKGPPKYAFARRTHISRGQIYEEDKRERMEESHDRELIAGGGGDRRYDKKSQDELQRHCVTKHGRAELHGAAESDFHTLEGATQTKCHRTCRYTDADTCGPLKET